MPIGHKLRQKELFYLMDYDFSTQHTCKLLTSGYPVDLTIINLSSNATPMLHCHEEVEFQYIAKGEATITCDEVCLHAFSGDILFINQSVKHLIAPSGANGCLLYCIVIHPSFIFGLGQLELENKYVNPILADSLFSYLHLHNRDQDYSYFLPLLQHLIHLHEEKECGYELLAKSYILQLWKLIYDRLPSGSSSLLVTARIANQDVQRVKQAVSFIQQHFAEPITLEDISNSILVSKSECCRCFKRTLGTSPIEYLMKYRITESVKYMHKRTHEPISEIAGFVGFNNTSYYNKVFRKFMGCTPTTYRQTLNKELLS